MMTVLLPWPLLALPGAYRSNVEEKHPSSLPKGLGDLWSLWSHKRYLPPPCYNPIKVKCKPYPRVHSWECLVVENNPKAYHFRLLFLDVVCQSFNFPSFMDICTSGMVIIIPATFPQCFLISLLFFSALDACISYDCLACMWIGKFF